VTAVANAVNRPTEGYLSGEAGVGGRLLVINGTNFGVPLRRRSTSGSGQPMQVDARLAAQRIVVANAASTGGEGNSTGAPGEAEAITLESARS